MKYDKQLCVDVILLGTPHEELFKSAYERIQARQSYGRGIHRQESETHTRLEGQEKELLTGIAHEYITGEILGVDSILSDGINVSANVSEQEAGRIQLDRIRFRVQGVLVINS